MQAFSAHKSTITIIKGNPKELSDAYAEVTTASSKELQNTEKINIYSDT
jgi:hypothetical protein